MLQKIELVLLVVLISVTAGFSQKVKELKISGGCNYYGESVGSDFYTFESDQEAIDAVDNILNPIGLVRNFDIRAADVDNAEAVIIPGDSTRYILYNQAFMRRVKNDTKTDWAAISIMAHEIGHHLNGHTLVPGGSRPKMELEADNFSGFVLYKMGATLNEAETAMNTYASEKGSATHPAKRSRLAAIEAGWTKAKDQDTSSRKTDKSKENPTKSETSDSARLVGTWEGEITENSYPQKITWQINADGTSNAWVSSMYGTMVLGTPGSRWSYSDGVIFGEGSSATVTWIDNNHIVLTIIQNEDGPSAKGRTRHYYRRK